VRTSLAGPQHTATLEYSQGSDTDDDPAAANESRPKPQKDEPKPQEDDVIEELRRSRQRASRQRPAKSHSPLAANTVPSLALQILDEAPRKYEDKAPWPPGERPPADPCAPLMSGSTKDLGANHAAASLRGAAATAPVPAPIKRTTYGGTLEGGRFVRTTAERLEELSEEQRQAIKADMEASKQQREQELQERQRQQRIRRKKEEQRRQEKFKADSHEVEAVEEERQRKKVKELKKWLKRKEEETRARKARDAEMLAVVMEKESQKTESAKKVEQERLALRQKRLHQAELKKAHLEAQLLLSRDAAQNELAKLEQDPGRAPGDWHQMKGLQQRHRPQQAQQMQQLQQGNEAQHIHSMQQLQFQRMQQWQEMQQIQHMQLQEKLQHKQQRKQQLLQHQQEQQHQSPRGKQSEALQQPAEQQWDVDLDRQLDQSQKQKKTPEEGSPAARRVLHRHVHHHVHYHDGSGDETGGSGGESGNESGSLAAHFASSTEEQRQIEAASEARVRAQLEGAQGGLPGLTGSGSAPELLRPPRQQLPMQHRAPVSEAGPLTPRMLHKAASMGYLHSGARGGPTRMMRSQESFRPSSLPALDVDLGRRRGLQHYSGSIQRAAGSYADSGRPRFARQKL